METSTAAEPGRASRGPSSELYDPFSPELQKDPYPVYAQLRDEHPLYRNDEHDFWALSRFDDIFRATRNWQVFSSARGLTFIKDEMKTLGLAPTFLMMDPPKHTQLRKLISKGFTRERVQDMESNIRGFVRQRLDLVQDQLGSQSTANIVELLTSPIPTYSLGNILGVPEGDRAQFDDWSSKIGQAQLEQEKINESVVAVAQLFQYFINILEERRQNPGDDMLSVLQRAEVEGERMTNWDILGFCFVFIAGGNDTTNHMLANGLRMLYEHPDQRALLVREPERIPGAIEEILRFEAPVQGLSRTLTQDVEYYGERVPAGSKMHLIYASGNRDEREFGDTAAELDVTRNVQRHMSFTQGPHFCIGAHLARLMGRIGLEETLARFPDYELDLDNAQRFVSTFTRGYEVLPFAAS